MSTINRSSKVDVWMPLYIGDYLSSTSRLTTEQHGAYLLLIMDYWKNGPLPDDDVVLAQICRMTSDAWSNARSTIRAFFEQDGSKLIHRRIDAELASAHEGKAKRKAKAEAAAAKRWAKDAPSNARSNQQAMPEPCPSPSPSPISTNVDIKDKRAPRFDAQAHIVGLGVDQRIARDWIAHRKAKKATPTLTAINGIVKQATKAGIALSDALTIACQRGWTGFEADWIAKDQPASDRLINGRQAAISNYAAQAKEARSHIEFPITERDITGDVVRVT